MIYTIFKEVRNTSLLNKAKNENYLNFTLNSGVESLKLLFP